jgi:hypothetical protein
MPRKRHSDEEILKLLREIQPALASGNDVGIDFGPLASGFYL